MISAVAARKAALAASQAASAPDGPVPSSSGLLSQAEALSSGSKRKSSTQPPRSVNKKVKKSKTLPKATQKALVQDDDFKAQANTIAMNSEDDSDSAISVLEDLDQEERDWSSSQPSEDSSSDEDETDVAGPLEISSLFPHLKLQSTEIEDSTIVSSFLPQLNNNIFITPTTSLIGLNRGETLCLLGTCTLKVISGSISILGTTLRASDATYPIFAPRSSPLPIIRAEFGAERIQLDIPQSLLQFSVIIALQELKTNIEGLGRICRSFEGVFEPSRWQKSSTETPFGFSGLYLVRQLSKECHAFNLPTSWADALDRATIPRDEVLGGVYLVKGPKNSGKSTFARTLLNRLLASYCRVAFLECDLGQSEFTPGGMVTLNIISKHIFGPPFTHPTLPKYAHYIGSTTPRSSPSHYIDAILALIQTYRLDVQTSNHVIDNDDPRISNVIPIVVNTMGWSKGLGADLTQKIERFVGPTDIFDIHAPTREEWTTSVQPIPFGTHAQGYGSFHDHSAMDSLMSLVHVLDYVPSSSFAAGYTPSDHRTLSIMSYFHARFPSNATQKGWDEISAQSWDVSVPLCAIPPYQVECNIAFDKIFLTGVGGEDVIEEEINRVLNGALVGFVACEPGSLDIETVTTENVTRIPYTQNAHPPSPASSNCVGIGLIRGVSSIDTEDVPPASKTFFHILTPLPPSFLENARVLVKGEMELPVWGMLDFRNFDNRDADVGDVAGVDRDNVPYLQWGKAPEGAYGAEKRKIRRNLMRRGQQ